MQKIRQKMRGGRTHKFFIGREKRSLQSKRPSFRAILSRYPTEGTFHLSKSTFSFIHFLSSRTPNFQMKIKYCLNCIDCPTLDLQPRNPGLKNDYCDKLQHFIHNFYFLLGPTPTSAPTWMSLSVWWAATTFRMSRRITRHGHQGEQLGKRTRL